MITLPPNEHDLQAYVDHRLEPADRLRLDTYLAAHPDLAAQVRAWQQDAQRLRLALAGGGQLPASPALDPAMIRQRMYRQSRRYLASAAVLLLAIGVGGLSGWQAREMALGGSTLPMTDALQAYRMFAVQQILAADLRVQQGSELQSWLDRYFHHAHRLPDLQAAGFKPVSGRLMSTDQGPAAMVLYEDPSGRRISFYIRPPGPNNTLLPRGSRRDGELQAEYWSSADYNYAMVSPIDEPAMTLLKNAIGGVI
ncbi:anti-sigma factor [Pseudomonas sp. LS1212]|uniref:anti-sigma factor family protein n=1 Tax=Pseudomonas sp. LS1212 TaxID=2972478 RepID=UPI00215D441C|nr:anti-sigma factor [Pseudomonas sp. LS1212]UVJ42355.1 anti-sigma factor [Pseudomonas sp. LS1212]